MRDSMRQPTKQPDLRPAKEQPSSGLRGGAYEKGAHDTPGKTWLHGGDPSTKPGYLKGRAGQQKKSRRWPF
jgi:hypothetical protein